MVGKIFKGLGLEKQGYQELVLPKFNHDKYLTDPCPQVHKSRFFRKHQNKPRSLCRPFRGESRRGIKDDHWALLGVSL